MSMTEQRAGQLRTIVGDRLVLPVDDVYDEARKIWNGAIDKKPMAIAPCRTREEVAAVVRWAADNDVEVAVRSGGHGVAGNALTDGGVVIDLRPMAEVRVDPATSTVKVGPGVLLGDLTRACQEHGLAVPSGIVSHTGVAGLTLGGGIGWIMRRYGLSSDNLISAEVVTADGSVVTAGKGGDPDLMWGLSGGGGNFGVVTEFEFRCHPVGPTVLAGPVVWPAEQAEDVLAFYREFASTAPPELTTIPLVRHAPPAPWIPAEHHWRPVVIISSCYVGSIEDGEKALAPLRSFGQPLLDVVQPRDFTEYHYLFDGSVPHGFGYYWKSLYLRDLDQGAIGVLTSKGWSVDSKRSYTIMFHLGGAIRDVDPRDSAFEDRSAEFTPNINAVWEDPTKPADVAWTREMFDALQPSSTGKTYVNFMSHDDQSKVAPTFGEAKLARLRELKRRYDPANVFHLNQNIPPAD